MALAYRPLAVGVTALLLLGGCASAPLGPKVQVLPGQNKPFDQFAQEQASCKQYANDQVNGQADDANTHAVGAALLTTALGAGLGAAVGGGHGAGVGAATGGVVGTAIGASNSQHEQRSIQAQYDNAFAQCMVAKGNQLIQPAPATVIYTPPPTVVYTVPPPVIYAPPPTVVYPPPPPPGY